MSQHTPQKSPPPPPQPSNGHTRVAEDAVTEPVALPKTRTVAARAYEKFVARGSVHGFDRADWMAAEQDVDAEQPAVGSSPPAKKR